MTTGGSAGLPCDRRQEGAKIATAEAAAAVGENKNKNKDNSSSNKNGKN